VTRATAPLRRTAAGAVPVPAEGGATRSGWAFSVPTAVPTAGPWGGPWGGQVLYVMTKPGRTASFRSGRGRNAKQL